MMAGGIARELLVAAQMAPGMRARVAGRKVGRPTRLVGVMPAVTAVKLATGAGTKRSVEPNVPRLQMTRAPKRELRPKSMLLMGATRALKTQARTMPLSLAAALQRAKVRQQPRGQMQDSPAVVVAAVGAGVRPALSWI